MKTSAIHKRYSFVLLLFSLNLLQVWAVNNPKSISTEVLNPIATDSWLQFIGDKAVGYANWGPGGPEIYTVAGIDALDPNWMTIRIFGMNGAVLDAWGSNPMPEIRWINCFMPIPSWPMTYMLIGTPKDSEAISSIRYTLTELTGTYTWTHTGVFLTYPQNESGNTFENIPTTNYVLWAFFGRLTRYDAFLNSKVMLVDRMLTPREPTDIEEFFVRILIRYLGFAIFDVTRNRIVIADLTTPYTSFHLDGPAIFDDFVTAQQDLANPLVDALIDSQRSSILFVVSYKEPDDKRRYIYDTDLAASTVGQPLAWIHAPYAPPAPLVAPFSLSNLANIGNFPLLIALANDGFYILKKADLLLYEYIPFPVDSAVRTRTLRFHRSLHDVNTFSLFFARIWPFNIELHKLQLKCEDMNPQAACQKCVSGMGWYRDSLNPMNDCIPKASFLPGYGVNEAQNLMSPCNALCSNCTDDYQVCTACLPTPGVFLGRSGVCAKEIALLSKRWDPYFKSAALRFDHVVSLESDFLANADVTFYTKDKNDSSKYILCESCTAKLQMKASKIGDYGVSIEFSLNQNLYDARMEIRPKAGSNRPLIFDVTAEYKEFRDYPIQVDNINLLGQNDNVASVAKNANVAATIIKSSNFVSKFLLVGVKVTLGIFFDQMMNTFTYLSLTDGDNLLYPSMVLDYMTGSSYLPLEILTNPFQTVADDPNCSMTSNFAKEGVQCSLLKNYGQELLSLSLIVALAVFVVVVTSLVIWYQEKTRKKEESKSTAQQGLEWIRSTYGFKWVASILEGNSLSFIGFSLINLFKLSDNKYNIAGFVVSLLIFVYFGFAMVATIKLALFLRKPPVPAAPKTEGLQRSSSNAAKQEESIASLETTENSDTTYDKHWQSIPVWYRWTHVIFRDRKIPNRPRKQWVMFVPPTVHFKNLLLQLILAVFGEAGVLQLGLIVGIEVVNLALLLLSRPHFFKMDNFTEISTQIMFVLFVGVKIGSIYKEEAGSRQEVFGGTMACALGGMVLLNLINFLYHVLCTLVDFARYLKERRLKRLQVQNVQESLAVKRKVVEASPDLMSPMKVNRHTQRSKSKVTPMKRDEARDTPEQPGNFGQEGDQGLSADKDMFSPVRQGSSQFIRKGTNRMTTLKMSELLLNESGDLASPGMKNPRKISSNLFDSSTANFNDTSKLSKMISGEFPVDSVDYSNSPGRMTRGIKKKVTISPFAVQNMQKQQSSLRKESADGEEYFRGLELDSPMRSPAKTPLKKKTINLEHIKEDEKEIEEDPVERQQACGAKARKRSEVEALDSPVFDRNKNVVRFGKKKGTLKPTYNKLLVKEAEALDRSVEIEDRDERRPVDRVPQKEKDTPVQRRPLKAKTTFMKEGDKEKDEKKGKKDKDKEKKEEMEIKGPVRTERRNLTLLRQNLKMEDLIEE
jgi:hypothetical protein